MFGTHFYGLCVELDGVLELVLLEQLVPFQLDVEGGLQIGHPEVGTGDDDLDGDGDDKDIVGEDDMTDVGDDGKARMICVLMTSLMLVMTTRMI